MLKKVLIVLFFLLSVTTIAQAAETTAEREARLRQELAQVEKEQAETEIILRGAQGQTASIERDILILNTKIKAAKLNIQAKNIVIEQLTKDIGNKDKKISSLEDRITRGKESLAAIYQKTYQLDNYSLPEIFLSQKSLTNFYEDIDSFTAVEISLKDTFEDIRDNKTQTQAEKVTLGKKKDNELDARASIESAKREVENLEKEKQVLLGYSRTTERAYEQVLADKRAKAAQIRAALFALRDTAAIPFEKALAFANEASRSTGVRPAFLLAILTQESALGKNVGTCLLTNPATGAGVSTKSGTVFPNVMKPGRDVEPFIGITKALGLDYSKTLVSCPQSVGWGGAMGPAQFIASTWMIFNDRMAAALKVKTPNPWEPEHAFMASSMYLADLGAHTQQYSSERNAACRYYSGRACDPKSINITYGTQVMAKAANIQETMINPLQGL
ncbi:MAG: hypothetical protein KBD47_02575 [Candidatus Pacebacteria bacterium]|jgi:membrane-bound lytic murein transglycosylase B|nr:hypothetical protein [Candidatus Paceibacterota bacterium]